MIGLLSLSLSRRRVQLTLSKIRRAARELLTLEGLFLSLNSPTPSDFICLCTD